MNDAIEILSSCKNQVCRLHRIWVTYNCNSCCMLYYRALLHVKIKIWKSTLKLEYFWFSFEWNTLLRYWLKKNQVCTPFRIWVTYIWNSYGCFMFYYRAVMYVKIKILLKLGYLLNERLYWDVNFMQKSSMYTE